MLGWGSWAGEGGRGVGVKGGGRGVGDLRTIRLSVVGLWVAFGFVIIIFLCYFYGIV